MQDQINNISLQIKKSQFQKRNRTEGDENNITIFKISNSLRSSFSQQQKKRIVYSQNSNQKGEEQQQSDQHFVKIQKNQDIDSLNDTRLSEELRQNVNIKSLIKQDQAISNNIVQYPNNNINSNKRFHNDIIANKLKINSKCRIDLNIDNKSLQNNYNQLIRSKQELTQIYNLQQQHLASNCNIHKQEFAKLIEKNNKTEEEKFSDFEKISYIQEYYLQNRTESNQNIESVEQPVNHSPNKQQQQRLFIKQKKLLNNGIAYVLDKKSIQDIIDFNNNSNFKNNNVQFNQKNPPNPNSINNSQNQSQKQTELTNFTNNINSYNKNNNHNIIKQNSALIQKYLELKIIKEKIDNSGQNYIVLGKQFKNLELISKKRENQSVKQLHKYRAQSQVFKRPQSVSQPISQQQQQAINISFSTPQNRFNKIQKTKNTQNQQTVANNFTDLHLQKYNASSHFPTTYDIFFDIQNKKSLLEINSERAFSAHSNRKRSNSEMNPSLYAHQKHNIFLNQDLKSLTMIQKSLQKKYHFTNHI